MVLKGLNWVHNDKIGSNGLQRSLLGTQYKYRGYLLRQVVFISLRYLWISVFDVALLKVELEMWFLQFLSLNLPENCGFHQNPWFSSKFAVFVKICSFHQNPQFLAKSAVFIKTCSFCQKPWIFLQIRGFAICL